MKNAEYQGNLSCPQRASAEHEGYAGAQSVGSQEVKEQGGADLLERILSRDNLNRAYKRVKANKGAPGIDGMTVEQALPWLREHREELLETTQRYLEGKLKLKMAGEVQAPAGTPEGNSQAGWRSAKAGYSNNRRPHHPAGNCTAANTNL